MTTPDALPTDRLAVAAAIPRSKNWPWYHESIGDKLTTTVKDLLEGYSGIPAEDMNSHVYMIRDMAWEIFPWPCIGEFWFISLGLHSHPFYSPLLARLKSDSVATLLDLGTCLGQDLRKLVYDGIPASQLHGSDLFAEFETAGYALWRDKEKFHDRFIAADIFATRGPLVDTEGTWDVISIFLFLHVWDLVDQKRACKRILRLLKPRPGSWIIGAQSGSANPKHMPLQPPFVPLGKERSVYRHSVDTFRKMWEEVGNEEEVSLDIWVEYQRLEVTGEPSDTRNSWTLMSDGDDYRRLYFLVKRL
ncbi:hypothetical protein MMC18_008176 [Xylographa bjoerkii]|nr:hypothetical protein [Xylographa bjoerkii]